jgi:hypothetical protein
MHHQIKACLLYMCQYDNDKIPIDLLTQNLSKCLHFFYGSKQILVFHI